jgi:hypothetical protein
MKRFLPKIFAVAISLFIAFSVHAQEGKIDYDANIVTGLSAIATQTEAGKTKLDISNTSFQSIITDEQKRLSYIIDFEDDVTIPYLNGSEPDDYLPSWHKPKMRRFITAFSQHYGFEVRSITSWTGNSASAFLSESQLKEVLQDPRVKRVTPNARVEVFPRSPLETMKGEPKPLFSESKYSLREITDAVLKVASIGWNIEYMGGSKGSITSDPTTIYIIDIGVGLHNNLPTMERVANSNYPTSVTVGCYPHAVHVAGIISGQGLAGMLGLYRDAQIVSVSVLDSGEPSANCLSFYPSTTSSTLEPSTYAFRSAFDIVAQKISKKGKMGVVTMSMNISEGNATLTYIYESLNTLVTPYYDDETNEYYEGAVFIQSAGNRDPLPAVDPLPAIDTKGACAVTFKKTQYEDKFIVVGALDVNGQPVVPLNGVNGFRSPNLNSFASARYEAGTRYDSCVDIWAPGNEIYSLWGDTPKSYGSNGVPTEYKQSENVTSSNYAYLSGTSMAAPHVAALAAYSIDYYGLTTPEQVKAHIVSTSADRGPLSYVRQNNGYNFNQTINIARFDQHNVPPSKPTMEFAFKGVLEGRIVNGTRVVESSPTFSVVNGSIKAINTAPIKLNFDSIGATSCTVTRYLNGTSQGIVSNSSSATLTLNNPSIGTYRWDAYCSYGSYYTDTLSVFATVVPAAQITWYVNGQEVSGTYYLTTGNPILSLSFSSTNATSCSTNATHCVIGICKPYSTFTVNNAGTSYSWQNSGFPFYLNPDEYHITAECQDGASGIVRKTQEIVVPPPPAPTVTWKINGKAVSGTVYMTTSDKFTFEYTSTNANNCDVKGEKSLNGNSWSPWYTAYNVGTSYNWGGALQQLAEGWYQWTAICTGSGGTTSQPLKMQVTFSACSASDTTPLYVSRYSGSYHDSYMTTNLSLHNSALSQGYVNAGTVAKLTKTKTHPTSSQLFKQYFSPSFINHYYSWKAADISYVLSAGWRFERDEGYIYDQQFSGTVPLYILWKNWNGSWDVEHRYTTNLTERNNWVNQGFKYDSIMGYVCP